MGIPKGDVHPVIVRGRHIGIGRDLVLIPTLQVPIGDRHALRRLFYIDHFHLGAVRCVGNCFAVDPVRTVFRRGRLRLERIVRRTNPNGRSRFPFKQRIVPTIRQGRSPRCIGVARNLRIPVVPRTIADLSDKAGQICLIVRTPL